jgi:DNA-binding transcriptional ArsR family regulator
MRRAGQSSGLGGAVHSLHRARYASSQRKAELIEEWTAQVIGPAAAAQLAFAVAAQVSDPDADKWIFVMISPSQNFAVLEWLRQHSKRPQVAVSLWGLLLTALRPDTGEILLSRGQIAERLGIEPDNVSRIVAELSGINALRREKEGRRVRYFLNANIATHIPGPEARKTAREAAGPLLVLMEGGKAQI